MLQVEGSKRWRLHAARAELAIAGLERGKGRSPAATVTGKELGKPLMDVTLRQGDLLYVPRGMIHHTSTAVTGETGYSLHMTLGLESDTVSATYNRLIICAAVMASRRDAARQLDTSWLVPVHTALQRAEKAQENSALRASLQLGFRDTKAANESRAVLREARRLLEEQVLPMVEGPKAAAHRASALEAVDEGQLTEALGVFRTRVAELTNAMRTLTREYARDNHEARAVLAAQEQLVGMVARHNAKTLGDCGIAVEEASAEAGRAAKAKRDAE